MAVLTDKQMDKHIKERNFAKVYLIYGEEQMYVKKYTDKLVTAVAGKTPSEFNLMQMITQGLQIYTRQCLTVAYL